MRPLGLVCRHAACPHLLLHAHGQPTHGGCVTAAELVQNALQLASCSCGSPCQLCYARYGAVGSEHASCSCLRALLLAHSSSTARCSQLEATISSRSAVRPGVGWQCCHVACGSRLPHPGLAPWSRGSQRPVRLDVLGSQHLQVQACALKAGHLPTAASRAALPATHGHLHPACYATLHACLERCQL